MVAQYEAGAADFVLSSTAARLHSTDGRLAEPGPGVAQSGRVLDVAAELDPAADGRQARAPGAQLRHEPPAHDRHRPAGHHQGAGPALAHSVAGEPAEKNDLITFDLDKARSLLQQAGATNWTLDLLYSAVSQEGSGLRANLSGRPGHRSVSTASSARCKRPRCSTPGTRRRTACISPPIRGRTWSR